MKPKYTERLDILHIPQQHLPYLADLNGIESSRPGVKYEIPVFDSVRNRDGHVTSFQKDLLRLRGMGVIFNVIPTPEGAQLIRDGKIDDKTHATIKPDDQKKLVAAQEKLKPKS